MSRMTAEAKLAKQMGDALSDIRFSTALFGQIIATGDPVIQVRTVELMVHTMEMVAINYDYGNFTDVEYPWLKLAVKVRNLIQNGDYNGEEE
jgi:hypothetical protein